MSTLEERVETVIDQLGDADMYAILGRDHGPKHADILLAFARTERARCIEELASTQPEFEDFLDKPWPGHWPLTMRDSYQSMYGDDMGEGVWGDACAEFQDHLRALATKEEEA